MEAAILMTRSPPRARPETAQAATTGPIADNPCVYAAISQETTMITHKSSRSGAVAARLKQIWSELHDADRRMF